MAFPVENATRLQQGLAEFKKKHGFLSLKSASQAECRGFDSLRPLQCFQALARSLPFHFHSRTRRPFPLLRSFRSVPPTLGAWPPRVAAAAQFASRKAAPPAACDGRKVPSRPVRPTPRRPALSCRRGGTRPKSRTPLNRQAYAPCALSLPQRSWSRAAPARVGPLSPQSAFPDAAGLPDKPLTLDREVAPDLRAVASLLHLSCGERCVHAWGGSRPGSPPR